MAFGELKAVHRFNASVGVFAAMEAGWNFQLERPHLFAGVGGEVTW